MTGAALRAGALACALMTTTALTAPAMAQEASITAFPVRQHTDENGVDLLSGAFTAPSPGIRIGDAELGLAYIRQVRVNLFRDTMMGTIDVSGSTYTVGIGGASEIFTLSGGTFTSAEQNGSTLTLSGGTYTYARSDGTVATFMSNIRNFGNAKGIVIATLTYPSGRALAFHYHEDGYTNQHGQYRLGRRLMSVTNNAGYHIKLSYASDTVTGLADQISWSRINQAMGLNDLVDSCAPTAFSCTASGRPVLTIPAPSAGVQDYTDAEGRTTRYTVASSGVTTIRLPGSTSDDVAVTYTSSRVSSITNRGVTTTYGYADASGVRTTTVTRPGSVTRVATFDIAKSLMLTDTNEVNETTSYQYDSNNRVTRITRPETDYTQFTYDARGNATETRNVAKSGSGLSDIVAMASYPSSCTNPITCNRPTSVTDARSNTTSFTYDSTHGGVLTVTPPAPSGGAVQPQTRFTYTRLDSSGSSSGSGTFRLTSVSQCQTQAAGSCPSTADEARTTVAYGQGLLPSSVTRTNGNASLTATTALSYDANGNLTAVDGPLSGTADTTRFRYNLNRERIGAVSPDPDGGGALKHRAQRITYGSSGTTTGLITKIETGTVDGTSDGDWAAFASLGATEIGYDANRRQTTRALTSSGTTYALAQTSYDGRGRVQCVAQRMNPSEFGSPPSDACTLDTAGSFGDDQITRTTYTAANQVSLVETGVGTGTEADDVSTVYTDNGRAAHVTDAEGNRTTYEYDGHDRLSRTRMPSPTSDGVSSTTDYQELTYDAGSNVTNRRLRDGNSIAYTYDALNRLASKDLPGSELTVTYGYDLLGRMTSAATSAQTLSFTYDALGRNLTQVGPHGTASYAYDLAGRRTQMTYPGSGLYVDYDYLVTGEVAAIRENGATSGAGVLATYAYDDRARRTSLTRGNGTTTSYSYDNVSRLTQLAQDLTSAGSDLTLTMSHNPASQIVGRAGAHGAYAWQGHYAITRAYTADGLNRYSAAGPITPTYDANGNLTSAGSITYSYSAENMLTGASGGVTLGYDPMLRLYETAGGTTTRMAYDGHSLIAEYNGSNTLQRRYVHGPGVDEPLVWYEGTGTSDRRWLHADERGSIVAASNGSGAAIGYNAYDEYGIPAAGNFGRFQYTGQQWLAELDMYHYRARIYSPTLGRFLQTDPIGYGDGMNIYAYVRNDPVNFRDPSGLCVTATIFWKTTFWPNGDKTVDIASISYDSSGCSLETPLDYFSLAGQNNGVVRAPRVSPSHICNSRLSNGSTIRRNVELMRHIGIVVRGGAQSVQERIAAEFAVFGFWLARVGPLGGDWAEQLGEPWGNWNYGATGRAAGIPLEVLLRGAGAAEQLEGLTGSTGSGQGGQGSPFGGPPYGDNRWSQEEIRQGYNARCE